jgi:MoaA/NifB/PqqE/SkfB family radical SAM enzyme
MLLDEISRRLESWAEGKREGPVRVELHPTDRCNLSCIFCWRSATRKKSFPEISERRILKIPKEAAELGVKEWVVSGGGEPLMRKEVTLKVLREIKRYKMWGLLTTNGTLLNANDSKFLVDIGWDQVQFSIDGPNAEINNYLRGINSFEKATKNLQQLKEIRDKSNSNKPFIGINTVLNRLNYDRLEEMIEQAFKIGAELVYFEPIYPDYAKERLSLNEDERKRLKIFVKRAIKKAKELGVKQNLEDFLEVQLADKTNFKETILKEVNGTNEHIIFAPCLRPWYLMGIKASGFSGCCSTFEVGEFINRKRLKDVWFGKTFEKIRAEMMKKKIPEYCSKCSVVVLKENRELRKILLTNREGKFLSS